MKARSAFTAIELMVVICIMAILIGMAVPGILGSLRKSRVNDAANSIVRASSQARQLARMRPARTDKFYGLVIVGDEVPSYVAVTFGLSTNKADILMSTETGKPLIKYLFSQTVLVYASDAVGVDQTPINGCLGWCYQYGTTAYPIQSSSCAAIPFQVRSPEPTSKTIDVGPVEVPASPATYPYLKQSVSIRSLDQRYRTGISVYRIGLINLQDS